MSKRSVFLDRRALLVTGLSSIALAACSGIIGPPDAAPLYMLRPTPAPVGGGPRVRWQLSIVLPEAPDSLDTNRIALVQPTNEMDYYANASWQDRLPFLIQSSLVQAFEGSSRIAAVGLDTQGLKSDYLLLTDIRDFQARYDVADAPPTAVVGISAKLVAVRGRSIAQAKLFSHEGRTSQNSVPAAVDAFNLALSATLAEIVDWTLSAPMPAKAEG